MSDEPVTSGSGAPSGLDVLDAPRPAGTPGSAARRRVHDRRGSWMASWDMITAKHLELRKRRGLMVAVVLLTVGLPVIVLGIRLIAHLASPHSYGPAGSPSVFAALTSPMAEFGFIIAATLGATAGTSDLTDGMFRHLVVTGRSRLALYGARLPAAMAIVLPLVALAFTLLCLVTAFAGTPQPTSLNENGVAVPLHLDQAQLESWLIGHPNETSQAFPNGPVGIKIEGPSGPIRITPTTPAQVRSFVTRNIGDLYSAYSNDERTALIPAMNELVKIGLWIELEVGIGLVVGLGLGSLIGQRTVASILMIVLEIIVTPILANVQIPHFVNGQRLVVGVAMDQLRPAGMAVTGGRRIFGGHAALGIPPMPTWAMLSVIIGWIVGWTAVGAWRMATRDA